MRCTYTCDGQGSTNFWPYNVFSLEKMTFFFRLERSRRRWTAVSEQQGFFFFFSQFECNIFTININVSKLTRPHVLLHTIVFVILAPQQPDEPTARHRPSEARVCGESFPLDKNFAVVLCENFSCVTSLSVCVLSVRSRGSAEG